MKKIKKSVITASVLFLTLNTSFAIYEEGMDSNKDNIGNYEMKITSLIDEVALVEDNLELINNYKQDHKFFEGEYLGNGKIKVGNTIIKIQTKTKINQGDMVKVFYKGNMNSFNIIKIESGNGMIKNNEISYVKTETSNLHQSGIFEISGELKGNVLKYTNKNGKISNIRVNLNEENMKKFDGKVITLKIKGTIHNFKVLEIK